MLGIPISNPTLDSEFVYIPILVLHGQSRILTPRYLRLWMTLSLLLSPLPYSVAVTRLVAEVLSRDWTFFLLPPVLVCSSNIEVQYVGHET